MTSPARRTILVSTLLLTTLLAHTAPAPGSDGTTPRPADFQHWQLAAQVPFPADNEPTALRVELGKMLFFDPRLSRNGDMSCASCHNPMLGWSDGLPTARGFLGKQLERASPTIVNAAYNTVLMWDGRKKDLEDQAMGPLEADVEMNTDLPRFFGWMASNDGYQRAFAAAYPGEPIGPTALRKAIASFERTVVSRTSPFDRWLDGEEQAMTPQQLRGLVIFTDKNKGNCVSCHAAPNFTDNGFHNIGLAAYGMEGSDPGRFKLKPVAAMRGAFKTPGLREIAASAPYFHDGSAKTLMDVIEHYDRGGVVRTNISQDVKPLHLRQSEKDDLVAFLRALSSPALPFSLPVLPPN